MLGALLALDRTGGLDGPTVQQELFGQCRFAGVRVRNNRKRAAALDFFATTSNSFSGEKGCICSVWPWCLQPTAAGILALRTIVSNVADLTRTRKEALQNDSAWTQPDTAIDKPAQDVPKPTTTPAATEKPSATPAPAAAQAPKATAAPPAQTVTKAGIWDAKPLAAFSGNELVYSATLGDWRTHNGADYAAPAGESGPPPGRARSSR